MKILILGQEGYIGTALTQYLEDEGHFVTGLDNNSRQNRVESVGSDSLIEKKKIGAHQINVLDYETLKDFIKQENPDTIVHLAEQPSAPYSMMNTANAFETQQNNILGTLNVLYAIKEVNAGIHLIKLGTEGEYPDWLWNGKHIPEGNRMEVLVPDIDEGLKEWEIPTPRYAGSWYHFSKLHDSMNIDYACKIWGLKVTDVNQGIVYGNIYNTRLDYDDYFGTVVHRFAVQAIAGHPLTVYGEGGQTRGFINLRDSIDAIKLLAENPPQKGLRVIHQTTEEFSVMEIATKIQQLTGCEIKRINNPREEMDSNKFTFDTTTLNELGLDPVQMDEELPKLLKRIEMNKKNIKEEVILPRTTWK